MDQPLPDTPFAQLSAAVASLTAEAEAAARESARLRQALNQADLRRRKLVTALESAIAALPPSLREEHAPRLRGLAEGMRPRPGRRPDSRSRAVTAFLAECAHFGRETVKVAEVQTHLQDLGFKRLGHGFASTALARLAEQGMVTKTAYGRYRINGLHSEMGALRLRISSADIAEIEARDRELAEAEERGRMDGRLAAWEG